MYSLSLLPTVGRRGCVTVGCCNNELCLHQLLCWIYGRTLPMAEHCSLLVDCRPDTSECSCLLLHLSDVTLASWYGSTSSWRQSLNSSIPSFLFLPLLALSATWYCFDSLCSSKVWVGNHQRSGVKMRSFTNSFFVIANWIVQSQWVFNLLSCPLGRRMRGKEKVF